VSGLSDGLWRISLNNNPLLTSAVVNLVSNAKQALDLFSHGFTAREASPLLAVFFMPMSIYSKNANPRGKQQPPWLTVMSTHTGSRLGVRVKG
jgi:hypothetical protein